MSTTAEAGGAPTGDDLEGLVEDVLTEEEVEEAERYAEANES